MIGILAWEASNTCKRSTTKITTASAMRVSWNMRRYGSTGMEGAKLLRVGCKTITFDPRVKLIAPAMGVLLEGVEQSIAEATS